MMLLIIELMTIIVCFSYFIVSDRNTETWLFVAVCAWKQALALSSNLHSEFTAPPMARTLLSIVCFVHEVRMEFSNNISLLFEIEFYFASC